MRADTTDAVGRGAERSHAPARVLWLGATECSDRALVGGKVAQLSALAVDFRVPPGFCLTAAAFASIAATDEGSVSEPALPSSLRDGVAATYRALADRCGASDPPVAVRSSAVDEDGPDSSFAGQYDTYLNVAGVAAVMDAVARCWASARAPRVRAYRRRQGFTYNNIPLAVLVQQLVVADVSAVVFSANPISGNTGEVVVTASWGLGESIVGGTVTPDTYTVRKADLTVLACRVAEKARMTVPVPGGTREVDVPRVLRRQAVLADEQVVALARMALALEARMGLPVDVECAYAGGDLYLLQCRPITTLAR